MPVRSYEIHEEMRQVARDLLAHVERLMLIVGQLEREKHRMADELELIRRELERYEAEQTPFSVNAGELEEENRRLAGRYGVLEKKIRELVLLDGSQPPEAEAS